MRIHIFPGVMKPEPTVLSAVTRFVAGIGRDNGDTREGTGQSENECEQHVSTGQHCGHRGSYQPSNK